MAASQRVVGGVSIDERLSVSAYGAVHKAHTGSRRDLRVLVVDAKLAAEPTFAAALLDDGVRPVLTSFDHPAIVPTVSIGRHDDDLVVVTVGPSRHVTVAELLAAAKLKGGTLSVEVAGAIARAIVQALAAAHQRALVHGAVHARSVAIDDAGHVKLFDFAVGRALTLAVASGADGSLWRGLGGALAPEVALGDPPTPAADVYAAGALLFTMITGDPPPGAVHSTPAVERVVRRALDTDPTRRFGDGSALLEALLEAFDDDRWSIADASELRRATSSLLGGRAPSDGNLDDDTEDLLASLGSAAKNVTPMRPSVDLRAAQMAARRDEKNVTFGLDTLLADLDEPAELTAVDAPAAHDPISEIIRLEDARQALERHDITPLPPPQPFSDDDDDAHGKGKSRKASLTMPARPRAASPVASQLVGRGDDTQGTIGKKIDEAAAISAISDLDTADVPAVRAKSNGEPPPAARAARRATSDLDDELAGIVDELPPPKPQPKPKPKLASAPAPVVPRDDIDLSDAAPPVRLKNPIWGVLWIVLILGGVGAGIYYYYKQKDNISADELAKQQKQKEREDLEKRLLAEQADPGSVKITSEPPEAAVWMLLGRTPFDSLGLPSSMLHEIRIELEGHTPIDAQVAGTSWTGDEKARVAKLEFPLTLATAGARPLPAVPPKPTEVVARGPFPPGRGTVNVKTTPPGAQVWLLVGITNNMQFNQLEAGRDYEFKVIKDGFIPSYVRITAEEWRDGGDPKLPLSAAPKKAKLDRAVVLVPDPNAKPAKPPK